MLLIRKESMMVKIIEKVVEAGIVLGLAFILSGCQTIKGVTGDTAWLAGKVSDSIVVPE